MMSITERLYYTDSHLLEFEARVVSVTERLSGWVGVTLDRTAFYPTGGGQLSDTGLLNGANVVECVDQEDAGVLHVIQGRVPPVGSIVTGQVDWTRRLDHIQQHTGQHILSQAFVKLFGAETRSFRMMDVASEIDVALDAPTDERIERAVELANQIIWEDRRVEVRQVSKTEAAELPLRKDSAREGELRIIEIEGYDLSPCGGTHAHRTGEVGIIAVRSWERAKGLTRLEFIAGGRVLADYRRVNRTARSVAAHFSVGRDEALISVSRLIEENKQLSRHVRHLEEAAARTEAEGLINEAQLLDDGTKIISNILEGREADALKRLAHALIAQPGRVVLLASSGQDEARLVFARSMDAPGDMNALMREACAKLNGRGGGRPDFAQGGGRDASKLAEALETATRHLTDE
jgi:alanyl-tRNA synthetase